MWNYLNSIKLDDFIDLVKSNIEKNSFLYFGDKKTIYKNVILNLVVLEKYFKKLAPYYISSEDRSDTSKFDKTLLSVLNTLVEAFGFMVSSSSKYISASIDALNIVDALQNKKIVDRVANFEEFLTNLNNVYYHKNNRVFWKTIKEIDEKFWKLKKIYYAKYSFKA